MKLHPCTWLCCGVVCAMTATAQTIIEDFEYATDEDLTAIWVPSPNAIATLSDSVAAKSTGKKSMRVEFSFPQIEWATETIKGQDRPAVVSIAPTQYLTFRVRGDTAFATADFRNLYLYAYDEDGNFGRWGGPVPATDEWQVINYLASTIEKPWDAPELPDLSRIIRFAFFQYGSQAAIDPYTASIYVDDLMVRDTPLAEFPPPSAPRVLIDDFETYANDAALLGAYSYENSPIATVTTATLATGAPQGSKALSLAIKFAPGPVALGKRTFRAGAAFFLPDQCRGLPPAQGRCEPCSRGRRRDDVLAVVLRQGRQPHELHDARCPGHLAGLDDTSSPLPGLRQHHDHRRRQPCAMADPGGRLARHGRECGNVRNFPSGRHSNWDSVNYRSIVGPGPFRQRP